MNILYISSEFHPVAKAGGLADAVTALSQALAARGHTVSVVIPRYGTINPHDLTDMHIPLGVPLGGREEWCGVMHRRMGGVDVYFLEHLALFGNRSGIYGPGPAGSYHDNVRRFALLSRGALQLALALRLQPDAIHAHDWPTGLVPALVNLVYRPAGHFVGAGTFFSIHNFGYQGIFAADDTAEIGLSASQIRAADIAHHDTTINLLKSAIYHSDRLIAVSPRYAMEIQQPRFGFGLHRDIQHRAAAISGILNGIDTAEWDPRHDPLIPATYSPDDLTGKWRDKRAVQRELGLPEDETIPLIGLVGRLVEQKGIEELLRPPRGALARLSGSQPVQFACLGSGEPWAEQALRELRARHPNFSCVIGYDNRLAHLIEAGSDFFLMPSRYEPCGLNQMYSMRYGTLPIVTRTGGLADTVDHDTGFFIEANSAEAIITTVTHALTLYRDDRLRIEQMRHAAMGREFSWDRSAARYEELYRA